jgi:hypothetical protein
VRDRLLFEVVEARDEILGEAALRRGGGRGVLSEPLAKVHAADALHHEREPSLDHLRQVDDPDDVRVVEAGEHLVLPTQSLFGRIVGLGDLERARATADQMARSVDDGHATLPKARDDLVVRADARARLKVVGVERRARGVWQERLLDAGRRVTSHAHRLDGLGQQRIAIGGAQLDHLGDGLVETERQALRDVAHPAHQPPCGHELARVLEERLTGENEGEHRAEAELVGRGLSAAEGRDHLGCRVDEPIVVDGRERDGGVARHLLREIEAGNAHLGGLLLVFDQHDLGAQQAMHHTLAMHLLDRLRDAHPEVGADTEVGLLLAAPVDAVALDPGGERDALEVLERQHDAALVGEGLLGAEHAVAAAQATKDLRLPAGTLGDAVPLDLRSQRRGAVDAEHALGARERVLPEQLGEGVVVVEGLDDLVLAYAAHRARALLHASEELEQLALGDGRRRERTPTAHALDEPFVLERGEDGLLRVDAIVARWAAHADVGGGREEDEPLGPHLARLVARVLQVRLEHLRGDAIELERAADLLGQPPVVVGAFDAASVRLDLDNEDRMRRDDDRVQLVDDAAALHEPRVAVDGEALGEPLDEESQRLPFGVVGGLADLNELGRHRLHQQDLRGREPDRELVLDAEESALVGVKSDDEVEGALAKRVLRVLEVGALRARDEVRVRRAELEADDARERQLLPRAAGDDEVVLQREVLLAADEVVCELAAGAGQLQHLLVRLHDVEVRTSHARRQAEELCLIEDVVGARGAKSHGADGAEPPVGHGLGQALGTQRPAHGRGIEGHAMQDGGVLEEERDEVDAREAASKARPRVELRFGETRSAPTRGFVPSEGMQQRCRPHTSRALRVG